MKLVDLHDYLRMNLSGVTIELTSPSRLEFQYRYSNIIIIRKGTGYDLYVNNTPALINSEAKLIIEKILNLGKTMYLVKSVENRVFYEIGHALAWINSVAEKSPTTEFHLYKVGEEIPIEQKRIYKCASS